MTSLSTELKDTIVRRLNRAPSAEILAIASTLCATEVPPQIDFGSRVALTPGHGLVKIAANGERVLESSTEWDAVNDDASGLMWTRRNVEGGRMSWAKAKDAAANVELCGYNDWRLPTIRELLTLVDYEKHAPAIDKRFFPECESAYYWTATPAASSPGDYAWVVNFNGGGAVWSDQGNGGFVRAVRASQ